MRSHINAIQDRSTPCASLHINRHRHKWSEMRPPGMVSPTKGDGPFKLVRKFRSFGTEQIGHASQLLRPLAQGLNISRHSENRHSAPELPRASRHPAALHFRRRVQSDCKEYGESIHAAERT